MVPGASGILLEHRGHCVATRWAMARRRLAHLGRRGRPGTASIWTFCMMPVLQIPPSTQSSFWLGGQAGIGARLSARYNIGCRAGLSERTLLWRTRRLRELGRVRRYRFATPNVIALASCCICECCRFFSNAGSFGSQLLANSNSEIASWILPCFSQMRPRLLCAQL